MLFSCDCLQLLRDFENEFSTILDNLKGEIKGFNKDAAERLFRQYYLLIQINKRIKAIGQARKRRPVKITNFLRF